MPFKRKPKKDKDDENKKEETKPKIFRGFGGRVR